ncbi:MAG TPA: pantoate--beta-alanine ligase [Bacteroidales bacterium]|nr:pantoate--beta-alanine ligase [Bacteroidales bacterium]
MEVFCTVNELQNQIKKRHLAPVGFVPTMGALHEGHLSLAANAVKLCPLVVVSIYVNPTQFSDKKDLNNYPRTPEMDLELLEKALRKTDIVFTPENEEIYPEEDIRHFYFGNLDNVMEALYRPNHFNGVAKVVSRLFNIVKPDIAIFGMKDFQQLAVIRELVRQTGNKVKIIGHPIVRENDGLAMSSRNRLLESGIRRDAAIIYKTISAASEMTTEHDISEIKSFVENSINNVSGFKVEYFDIVDDTDLIPLNKRDEINIDKRYYGCIAVKAGNIRLIDNIEFGLV